MARHGTVIRLGYHSVNGDTFEVTADADVVAWPTERLKPLDNA